MLELEPPALGDEVSGFCDEVAPPGLLQAAMSSVNAVAKSCCPTRPSIFRPLPPRLRLGEQTLRLQVSKLFQQERSFWGLGWNNIHRSLAAIGSKFGDDPAKIVASLLEQPFRMHQDLSAED